MNKIFISAFKKSYFVRGNIKTREMMQVSKNNKNFYSDVNKVSNILSKVVLMRRRQERSTFAEKPIKRKGSNSHPNDGNNPTPSR